MREIKFRAWHKLAKKMYKAGVLSQDYVRIDHQPDNMGRTVTWLSTDDIELMQYTGLKDTKGQDIYEGDIVNYLDSNMTIAWSDILARPILQPYTIEHHYDLNSGVAEECEIIGNIFVNAELVQEVSA